MSLRAAYRYHREHYYIRWEARLALALGFDAYMLAVAHRAPWYVLVLGCAFFPSLVALGIYDEVREYKAREASCPCGAPVASEEWCEDCIDGMRAGDEAGEHSA